MGSPQPAPPHPKIPPEISSFFFTLHFPNIGSPLPTEISFFFPFYFSQTASPLPRFPLFSPHFPQIGSPLHLRQQPSATSSSVACCCIFVGSLLFLFCIFLLNNQKLGVNFKIRRDKNGVILSLTIL
ncbi:hypothetical protein ES332_A11G337200v1 [Gossypium tomentosum]|uniref:Transmembrane protein n=1 Tax=Gossypium tomentosum TaxID=34277 RepID=A0A5D2NJP8_GOSTO|nr:hypothetical protein ES332_A11G337200v1 [Gossypium tomentosum]